MLTVNHLTCERDDRLLFKDVSFFVDAGDIVQIKGANGSGKTTLLRCLAGLFDDYSGDILWQLTPYKKVFPTFVANLMYFGHQIAVKLNLTVAENVSWYAHLHGGLHGKNIDDALARVGLSGMADVLCSQLSEGQKRRVALARLLVSHAALWILDEPFSAIDRTGVAQLEDLLMDHAKAGGAVIVTSHHEMQRCVAAKNVVLGEPV